MRFAAPAALFLASFALPASSQGPLTLDVAGGLLGEPFRFSVGGGEPGDLWIVCLSDTLGPLPISSVDPFDTRNWDMDFTMFLYPAGFGPLPVGDPAWTITNYDPNAVGAHLYSQAFTIYGSTTLVDQLSNTVVIEGAPGHGASVDALSVPLHTRGFVTGARLPDGDHIVFGGNDGALQGGTYLKTTERFGRKMQTIAYGPDLATERSFAASVVLNDGRVLICGGNDDLNNTLTSADLYDPATNTRTATGSMSQKRYFHSLVKMADGRVMALGGSTSVDNSSPFNAALALVNSATNKAEIYNPATGTWSIATNMPWSRTGLSAALLPDGKVLAAGGAGPFLGFFTTAARYNPATGLWVATASMPSPGRALATTATLPDGRILVTGGAKGNIATLSLDALADVSSYDNATNAWTVEPALSIARAGHTATFQPSSQNVIVCGGAYGNVLSPNVTTSVEAWVGTGWFPLGSMNHERAFHYAGLSHDGERVFLFGGIETFGSAAGAPTAEFFAP